MTPSPPTEAPGLGRLWREDWNDLRFLAAERLPEKPKHAYRYWHSRYQLDQGRRPWCVEYGWHHWLLDGPVTQGRPPLWTPGDVYHPAQRIDEWEGENYDGTSVRAGAKVLQQAGFIGEYRWALTIEELVDCVCELGPMVVGFDWYEGMEEPWYGYHHSARMELTGSLLGGHAFLLNGANRRTELFRVRNSRDVKRYGQLSFADAERLLVAHGEAVIATEVRRRRT